MCLFLSETSSVSFAFNPAQNHSMQDLGILEVDLRFRGGLENFEVDLRFRGWQVFSTVDFQMCP